MGEEEGLSGEESKNLLRLEVVLERSEVRNRGAPPQRTGASSAAPQEVAQDSVRSPRCPPQVWDKRLGKALVTPSPF